MIRGAAYNVDGVEPWAVYVDTDTGKVQVTRGIAIVAQGRAITLDPLVIRWDPPPGVSEAEDVLERALAQPLPPETDPLPAPAGPAPSDGPPAPIIPGDAPIVP